MIIELKFQPTLNLLACILMANDINNKLPDHISKTWIKTELSNYFYINGISILGANPIRHRYMDMAEDLNKKYNLCLV
jgi:hypothetical protein